MISDFKSILDLIKTFPSEQECIDHLEYLRWKGNVWSPFDTESKVYKCAGNKYKCKETGKYFNVKIGTIFDNTKIPLIKWFMALYIFSSHKKGISSHQLAKDIDVQQKTAWFLLHRLRYAFDHPDFQKEMNGVVEIDETYVGGKDKNKHENKKTHKTGRGTDKAPVLGIKSRKTGNVLATVVADTTMKSIMPIIQEQIRPDSITVTDDFKSYAQMHLLYTHTTVNHSAKQFVNGMFHTNGIENFWSHLKRGIDGIYHWVSVDHLQSYVNEFSLRYNTRKFTTSDRFNYVLDNMDGHLTYKQLIRK